MSSAINVQIKSHPNQDLVCGFPGIPATWPRVEGTVEIRSPTLSAMLISQVFIALYRTDTINVPSARTTKRDKSYLIGEKIQLYQATKFQAEGGNSSPVMISNSNPSLMPVNTNSSTSSQATATNPALSRKYDQVLGLDLDFVLPLPVTKHLPSSISLPKRSVETTYQLFVTVVYNKNLQTAHYPFPVRIKRYDKLSTFGQFHVPLKGNVVSADHLVEFEYSIPQSSFGPRDSIVSYVKITPNLDLYPKARKIKLNKLSVQVVESVTYNITDNNQPPTTLDEPPKSPDKKGSSPKKRPGITSNNSFHSALLPSTSKDSTESNPPPTPVATINNFAYIPNPDSNNSNNNSSNTGPIERRRKLCKASNTLDLKLPETGYRCEITMDFPSRDLREPKSHPGGVVPCINRADVPFPCYSTGFTTSAPLYRVDYLLVFKAKFSHSKDILIEQPITVTPYEHVMCVSLMKSIKDAVDEANERSGVKDEYVLNSSFLHQNNILSKHAVNAAMSASQPDKHKKKKKHRDGQGANINYDENLPELDPNKRLFVPKVFHPHDSASFAAYGVNPTGPLGGNNNKPMLLIR